MKKFTRPEGQVRNVFIVLHLLFISSSIFFSFIRSYMQQGGNNGSFSQLHT